MLTKSIALLNAAIVFGGKMSNSGLFHREIGSAVMARDGEEDTDCSAASIPVWGEQQQMQKYQHSAEEEGATP